MSKPDAVSASRLANAELGVGYASWIMEAAVLTFECQNDIATGLVISAKYQMKSFPWSGHISISDTRLQAEFGPYKVGFRFDKNGVGIQASVYGQEATLHVDRDGVLLLFKSQVFGIQTKTSPLRLLQF